MESLLDPKEGLGVGGHWPTDSEAVAVSHLPRNVPSVNCVEDICIVQGIPHGIERQGLRSVIETVSVLDVLDSPLFPVGDISLILIT